MQITSVTQVEKMRKVFAALYDDIAHLISESGPTPVGGSIAAREKADRALADQLDAAYSQGNVLFESAADHAFAACRLLTEPVQTMAPWTCLRGGLEASALASWLLDAAIDSRERVSRSFALRYGELRQQSKIATDESTRNLITSRIDEIDSEARSLGYRPVLDKKNRLIAVGQLTPSATQCISTILDEEVLYRVCSAVAHGQWWALSQLGFRRSDNGADLVKSLNSDVAAYLVAQITEVLSRPAWAMARLFGYDLARLSGVLERRYKQMGLKDPPWIKPG